eukprot:CAMPEP_0170167626 /NCGR_PEP_ID=MMETSP0040_2-20121228/983_1 /TAXON_ID=641309 /ORGANISM="Lotharella oceanica, Strain CCMP622" /LENGTH=248 /DNA_ID=CAMNT_0010405715 /DNA_START=231 /DNA_END=974 /DNA_ORIENTATION=+
MAGVRGPLKWSQIPPDAQALFLMNSSVQLLHHFLDGTKEEDSQLRAWSNGNIRALIDLAQRRTGWRQGFPCGYPLAPDDMYDALDRFSVEGYRILVVGSETPWVEAILIGYGNAKHVTTVDFKPLPSNDYVETVLVDELDESFPLYDAVVTFSSIEHDGLGRYGDPMHPFADIERMQGIRSLVRSDGLIFLAVPIGRDSLVWNAHRIYGEKRFNLLTRGWIFEAIFGGTQDDLRAEVPDASYHFQPLW